MPPFWCRMRPLVVLAAICLTPAAAGATWIDWQLQITATEDLLTAASAVHSASVPAKKTRLVILKLTHIETAIPAFLYCYLLLGRISMLKISLSLRESKLLATAFLWWRANL